MAAMLGEAKGIITLDISDLSAKVSQATASLGQLDNVSATGLTGLEQKLNAAGVSTQALGMGMVGLGAAILAPVGIGIKAAMNLEQSFKDVEASIPSDQRGRMPELEKMITKIGASGQYSAGEMASVTEELAKSGFEIDQILSGDPAKGFGNMAQSVSDLSSATGSGLAPAVAGISSAMNIWNPRVVDSGIALTDAARAADIFTVAANESSADVTDIIAGMRNFGPTASAMGIGFEDAAGAVSLFTGYGLKATDVGTSLTRALTVLAKPTAESATLMQELGINAFDAQGKFVGLPTLFDQVQASLGHLSHEQQQAAIATIFGAEAMDVMTIAAQTGSAGLTNITGKMEEVGIASEQAKLRTQTLKGALERLTEGFTTMLAVMMSGAIPGLTWLANAMDFVTSTVMLIPQPILAAMGLFAAFTGAALVLGGAFLLAAPKISAFIKTIQILSMSGGRLGGVANALLRVAGAARVLAITGGLLLGAFGLGFLAYKANFLGFADTVDRFIDRFRDGFNRLGDSGNILSNVLMGIASGLRSIMGDATPAWLVNLAGAFQHASELAHAFFTAFSPPKAASAEWEKFGGLIDSAAGSGPDGLDWFVLGEDGKKIGDILSSETLKDGTIEMKVQMDDGTTRMMRQGPDGIRTWKADVEVPEPETRNFFGKMDRGMQGFQDRLNSMGITGFDPMIDGAQKVAGGLEKAMNWAGGLKKEYDYLREKTGFGTELSVLEAMSRIAPKIFGPIMNQAERFGRWTRGIVEDIPYVGKALVKGFDIGKAAIGRGINAVQRFGSFVGETGRNIGSSIKDGLSSSFDAVSSRFTRLSTLFGIFSRSGLSPVRAGLAAIAQVFPSLSGPINAATGAFDAFRQNFDLMGKSAGPFGEEMSTATRAGYALGETLKQMGFERTGNAVIYATDKLGAFGTGVQSAFGAVTGRVGKAIDSFNYLRDQGMSPLQAGLATLKYHGGVAFDAIREKAGQFGGVLMSALGSLGGMAMDLAGWALNIGIPKLTGWITGGASALWDLIKQGWTNLNLALNDWGVDLSEPDIAGWMESLDAWLGKKLGWDTAASVPLTDWVADVGAPKLKKGVWAISDLLIDLIGTVSATIGALAWDLMMGDPAIVYGWDLSKLLEEAVGKSIVFGVEAIADITVEMINDPKKLLIAAIMLSLGILAITAGLGAVLTLGAIIGLGALGVAIVNAARNYFKNNPQKLDEVKLQIGRIWAALESIPVVGPIFTVIGYLAGRLWALVSALAAFRNAMHDASGATSGFMTSLELLFAGLVAIAGLLRLGGFKEIHKTMRDVEGSTTGLKRMGFAARSFSEAMQIGLMRVAKFPFKLVFQPFRTLKELLSMTGKDAKTGLGSLTLFTRRTINGTEKLVFNWKGMGEMVKGIGKIFGFAFGSITDPLRWLLGGVVNKAIVNPLSRVVSHLSRSAQLFGALAKWSSKIRIGNMFDAGLRGLRSFFGALSGIKIPNLFPDATKEFRKFTGQFKTLRAQISFELTQTAKDLQKAGNVVQARMTRFLAAFVDSPRAALRNLPGQIMNLLNPGRARGASQGFLKAITDPISAGLKTAGRRWLDEIDELFANLFKAMNKGFAGMGSAAQKARSIVQSLSINFMILAQIPGRVRASFIGMLQGIAPGIARMGASISKVGGQIMDTLVRSTSLSAARSNIIAYAHLWGSNLDRVKQMLATNLADTHRWGQRVGAAIGRIRWIVDPRTTGESFVRAGQAILDRLNALDWDGFTRRIANIYRPFNRDPFGPMGGFIDKLGTTIRAGGARAAGYARSVGQAISRYFGPGNMGIVADPKAFKAFSMLSDGFSGMAKRIRSIGGKGIFKAFGDDIARITNPIESFKRGLGDTNKILNKLGPVGKRVAVGIAAVAGGFALLKKVGPGMRKFGATIGNSMDRVGDAFKKGGISGAVDQLITEVGNGLRRLPGIIRSAISGINWAALGSLVLTGLLMMMTGPLGILAAIFQPQLEALLANIFGSLGRIFSAFKTGGFAAGMKQIGEETVGAFKSLGTNALKLGDGLKSLAEPLSRIPIIGAPLAAAVTAMGNGVNWLGNEIMASIPGMQAFGNRILEAGSKLRDAFNEDGVRGVINALGPMLMNGLAELGGNISSGFQTALGVLKDVGIWVGEKLGGLATSVGTWLTEQLGAIQWGESFKTALAVLSDIGAWMVEKFVEIGTAIGTWLGEQLAAVPWQTTFETALTVLSAVGSWIVTAIKAGVSLAIDIGAWIYEQLSGVPWQSLFELAFDTLKSAGSWILTKITEGATELATSVGEWILGVFEEIQWQESFETGIEILGSAGKWILDKIITYHPGILIGKWFYEQMSGISWQSLFDLAINALYQAGQWIVDKVQLGASTLYSGLKGWAEAGFKAVMDVVQPIIDDVVSKLSTIIDNLNKIPGVKIPNPFKDLEKGAGSAADEVDRLNEAMGLTPTPKSPSDPNSGIYPHLMGPEKGPTSSPKPPTQHVDPDGNIAKPVIQQSDVQVVGAMRGQMGALATTYTDYAKNLALAAYANVQLFTQQKQQFQSALAAGGAMRSLPFAQTTTGWQGVAGALAPVTPALTTVGGRFVTTSAQAIGSTLGMATGVVGASAGMAAGLIGSTLGMSAGVVGQFTGMGGGAIGQTSNMNTGVVGAGSSMAGRLGGLVSSMGSSVTGYFGSMQKGGTGQANSLNRNASGAASGMSGSVIGAAGRMNSGALSQFGAMNRGGTGQANSLKGNTTSATGTMANTVVSTVMSMVGRMIGGYAVGTAATGSAARGWVGIIQGIAGAMSSAGNTAGLAAGMGVAVGIASAHGAAVAAANRLASAVNAELRAVIKPGSPSKVTTIIGHSVPWGIETGIEKGTKGAVLQARDTAMAIVTAMRDVFHDPWDALKMVPDVKAVNRYQRQIARVDRPEPVYANNGGSVVSNTYNQHNEWNITAHDTEGVKREVFAYLNTAWDDTDGGN